MLISVIFGVIAWLSAVVGLWCKNKKIYYVAATVYCIALASLVVTVALEI